MSKVITIVTGCGRCGSTMVMRMLHKGGMDVVGNHIAYEDDRGSMVKKNDLWLAEAQGKAIKLLDLQLCNLPDEFTYQAIFLKRDHRQQAKSIVKFAQQVAQMPIKSSEWKRLSKDLPKDEMKSMEMLVNRGIQYQVMQFEEILKVPLYSATVLRGFLQLELDTVKMAGVVMQRSPECSPDMSIEASFLNQ